ncbi:hypothetical protein YB2330_003574 [Saitoella coloradoensis]
MLYRLGQLLVMRQPIFIVGAITLLGWLVLLFHGIPKHAFNSIKNVATSTAATEDTATAVNEPIHLLIPATESNEQFCRVLFSALINNYPPPYLVNYGKKYDDPAIARAQKIAGLNDYLLKSSVGENDTIIIADGFDVWFQLPLNILVSRYHNAQGKDTALTIFGADKKCWPNDPDSPACTRAPLSSLPDGVYGPDTDQLTIYRDHKSKYDNFRPRWLNSGTAIGPASSLHVIYKEAWKRIADKQNEVTSDQRILADVWGDGLVDLLVVDHRSELFQAMGYAQADVAWIVNPDVETKATTASFVDKGNLTLELTSLGMDTEERRARSVWKGRPLAWNRISNAIPTVLHFNGDKEYMHRWWHKMWWNDKGGEVARTFLEKLESGGTELLAEAKAGAWTEQGWVGWNELCGDYLTRIRAREPIPELQDKTLLLLGDSVDRFTVVDFCSQYVGKNASAHPLDSFTGIVSQILPNMGGYSRSCYLDYLNLKVAWSFFYGFDETDMWQDKKSAYTAPGQFSERWRLSLEALKTIPTPNLVMVNAGFWELARFDRLYERAYKSEPDPPTVSTEFLNEYIGLTTQWLADVRKAVGSSPRIRWRQTHYPGKATGSYFTIAGEKKKPRARFHEVKIRALNAAAGVAVQQASEAELRSRISWPEKPGLGELQDDGSITIWPIGDIMSGWDTKLWVRDEIHQTADVGSFVFGESLMEYLARSPR